MYHSPSDFGVINVFARVPLFANIDDIPRAQDHSLVVQAKIYSRALYPNRSFDKLIVAKARFRSAQSKLGLFSSVWCLKKLFMVKDIE